MIGRALLGIVSAALVTMLAKVASAASPDAPEAASETASETVLLARMDAELELFAEQARAARLVLGLTTLTFAAVLVPTGVTVATRPGDESRLVAGGLILGGATPLIPAITALFPSKVESLRQDSRARQAAGRPASETLQAIESGWRSAAEENRKDRMYVGIAGLVLGSAALATGLVFMLERPGFGGLDETTQYTLGSAFIGAGVPIGSLAFRTLVQPSVEETSWEAYRRMKIGGPSSASVLPIPSLSVVPARGGAIGALTASF
jgi:hypothetical protein